MQRRKCFAVLLSLMMLLSCLPASSAWATNIQEPNINDNTLNPSPSGNRFQNENYSPHTENLNVLPMDGIEYLDKDGVKVTNQLSCLITEDEEGDVTWDKSWYAVTEDVTIDGSVLLKENLNLILADGVTLTVKGAIKGESYNEEEDDYDDYDLTVYGQEASTGKLVVKGTLEDVDQYGIRCDDLVVNGGVIEASAPDTSRPVINTAIDVCDFTLNAGTVTANGGDVWSYDYETRLSAMSEGIYATNLLMVNGGTLTAKGGKAKDARNDGHYSHAISAYQTEINGGTVITDFDKSGMDTANYDIYRDFSGMFLTINGGTVKSARANERVLIQMSKLSVSGGNIGLEKGYMIANEIVVSGEKKLSDLLPEDTSYWYRGEQVDTKDISQIGLLNEENYWEWISILGEEDDIASAYPASVTYTDENNKQQTKYPSTLREFLAALVDENTKSITLFSDIVVFREALEEFVEKENELVVLPIFSRNLSLDLNGHNFTVHGSQDLLVMFIGNVVIKDSSLEKNGMLSMPSVIVASSSGYNLDVTGKMTVESGTVSASNALGLIYGELNVTGGNVCVATNDELGIGVVALYGKIRMFSGLLESSVNLMQASYLEMSGGTIGNGSQYNRNADDIGTVIASYGSYVNISGGKVKFLGIDGDANALLSGGEFELVSHAGGPALSFLASGYAYYNSSREEAVVCAYPEDQIYNVTVKPHNCEFELKEEEWLCECGRIQATPSGTAEDAIAKVEKVTPYGDVKTVYVSTYSELLDVLDGSFSKSVTLLKDVANDGSTNFFDLYGNMQLDLNGHTLDLSYTEEEDTEFAPFSVYPVSTLTVKDSSATKSGVMKIGAFEIATWANVTLQSGKIICNGYSNEVMGNLILAGATLDCKDEPMYVTRGSLTVADGELSCEEIALSYSKNGGISVMAESSEESLIPEELQKLIPEARDKAENMLISGGKVKGSIWVLPDLALRVTGGKVGDIISIGGQVTITDGEIESLYVDYFLTDSGFTKLSGGSFDEIALSEGSEKDMQNFLVSGYAYYSTKTGEPVLPTEGEDNTYTLQTVKVASHTCNFDAEGKCACGRTGKPNIKAVSYLDAKGNKKQTTSYQLLTRDTTKLTNGWYVVNGNISLNHSLTVEGDEVKLILTDGSSLTVNGKIAKEKKEATLFVFGQEKNSGRLSVSGASQLDEYGRPCYMGLYLDDLEINGGIINVVLGDVEELPLSADALYILGKMVVNGGVVNAKGASLSANSDDIFLYSDGIYMVNGEMTINGGSVKAIGGNLSANAGEIFDVCSQGLVSDSTVTINGGELIATGGDVRAEFETVGHYITSVGIRTAGDFILVGGDVTAVSGKVDLKRTGTHNDSYEATSAAVSSDTFRMSGGNLQAIIGEAKATGNAVSVSSSGIESQYTAISGGNTTISTVADTFSSKAHYIGVKSVSEMWMNGGNISTMSDVLMYDIDADLLTCSGGNFQNKKLGALKGSFLEVLYQGGTMKFIALQAESIEGAYTDTLNQLLADGAAFYNRDRLEYIDASEEKTLSNVCVLYAPISVFLNVNDLESKAVIQLSALQSLVKGTKTYAPLDVVDESKLSASLDQTSGALTISPKAGAVAGETVSNFFSVGLGDSYSSIVEIRVHMTGKTIPSVTVTGGLEKVYDGKEIDAFKISDIATVTDGENTVLGTWQWLETPINITNGVFNAQFVPQDEETYATATVSIPVKITAKELTGEPSYQLIEEAGKTLADAALVANKAWPKGNISWVDKNGVTLALSTEVTSGTAYQWKFVPSDSINYEAMEGRVVLYTAPASEDNGYHNSGSNHSKNDTTTVKNPDGSTTVTKENQITGTVTETTQNKDGSSTVVETKKDGTVTTTEKDKTGNTVETVKKPDGSSTVTETRKDGTTVTTKTDETGTTTSEIQAPDNQETEITIPVDNAEEVTKIIVTDSEGNKREITEFEKTERGISMSVSGDCSVEISREKTEKSPETKGFSDISGHWGEKSILFVLQEGLMNGISEDKFAPEHTLTRGMLVTILYRAAGSPAVNKSISFADVTADGYYHDAVIWAQQNGIISGISESEFAPDENITREQIATILYRYAKANGYDVTVGEDTNILSYSDFSDISEYALEAMQYAVGSGLIQGKTETTLNPKDNATRAEIATILQRFLEANAK